MMVYTPESERFELGMISADMPSVLTILKDADTGSLFFDQLISGCGDAFRKKYFVKKNQSYAEITKNDKL